MSPDNTNPDGTNGHTTTTATPYAAGGATTAAGVSQFSIDTGIPQGLEGDPDLQKIVDDLKTATDPDVYNQLVLLKQQKINQISSQRAVTPGMPGYGNIPDTPEIRANIEKAGKDISEAHSDIITFGKGGIDAFNLAMQKGLIPKDSTYVPGEGKKWGYVTKDQLQTLISNLVSVGAIKDGEQLRALTSDPSKAYAALQNVGRVWQISYDNAVQNLDKYKSGDSYDLMAALDGGISHSQIEQVFGKDVADKATAAKREQDDFNAHNTKLPDGQYIANTDLSSLKDSDPDGYKVLTDKGFDAYQKYVDDYNAQNEQKNALSKAEFERQLKESLDKIKASYDPQTADVLSNLFEAGARTGDYKQYDAAVDNITRGQLIRDTDFKQNNTHLPDGNWIANNDLETIRTTDPEGFKLLNEKGFDKYDAYVAQKNFEFNRYQTASPQGKLGILIGEGKVPVGSTLAGVDKDGNISYYPPATQSTSPHSIDVTKPGPFGLLYFKSTGDIAKMISADDFKSLDKEFTSIPAAYRDQIIAEKIRNDVLHGKFTNAANTVSIDTYNRMSDADKKDVLATYLLEQSPDRLAQIQTRRAIVLGAIPIVGTAVYWNQMSTPWKVASVAGDALSLGLIDIGRVVKGIKNLPKVPGLPEVEQAVREGRQAELATLKATTTPKVVAARVAMFKDMDAYARNLSEIEHFTSVVKEAPLAGGGRITGYEKILGELKAKTPSLEGKLIHSGNEFQTLQATTGAKGMPGAMHEALLSKGSAFEQVGKAGLDMPVRFRLGQQTANQIQDSVKAVYSEAPSKLPDLIKQRTTLTGQIIKAQSAYKSAASDLARARNLDDIQTLSRKLGDVNRQISISQKLDFNRMLQVKAKINEEIQGIIHGSFEGSVEADWKKGIIGPYPSDKSVMQGVLTGEKRIGLLSSQSSLDNASKISREFPNKLQIIGEYIFDPSKVKPSNIKELDNLFNKIRSHPEKTNIVEHIKIGQILGYSKNDIAAFIKRNVHIEDIKKYAPQWVKAVSESPLSKDEIKRITFLSEASKINDARIKNFLKEDLGTEVHGVNPRDKWSGIWGGGSTAVKTKVINPELKPLSPSVLRRAGASAKTIGTAAKVAGGAVTAAGRTSTAYETPDQTRERLRREAEAGTAPEDVTSKQIPKVPQKGISPAIKPIIVPKPGLAPRKTPLKAPVVHPTKAPTPEPAKLPAKTPAKLPAKTVAKAAAITPKVTVRPGVSKVPTPIKQPKPQPKPEPAPSPVPRPTKVKAPPKTPKKPTKPDEGEKFRFPFFSPNMTDAEKRAAIKKAGGAFYWQQGQLQGKKVYHVGVVTGGKVIPTTVLGKPPEGAIRTQGTGQAKRTIRVTRGSAPERPVKLEGGAIDVVVSPTKTQRGVTIDFVRDPKYRGLAKSPRFPSFASRRHGKIIETRIGGRTVLSRRSLRRR